MNFDTYGNLTPYKIIEVDIKTFESMFVHQFDDSITRKEIFGAYINYVQQLKSIIETGFWQWIDGSFITQKTNPKDIDVVTFLDWQKHRRFGSRLESLRSHLVDANLGSYYAPDHKYHPLFLYEKEDWTAIFGSTKDGKYRKGIIQINF